MRKIAILTFLLLSIFTYSQENTDGHYTIGILPVTSAAQGADQYLENMQATITEAFEGKTRFTVVDRTKFEQLATERNLQKQEDFINSNSIVEQGKTVGAQFLISSSITLISRSGGYVERTRYVTGSDGKLYPQKYDVYIMTINIALNVQIIDVETGKVKSNRTISEPSKWETTNEGVAIPNAIKGLGGNLKAWLNDAFPVFMRIIKVESLNKKGHAESVLIKGGSEMDLSRTKGIIFSSSSELLVYENEIMMVDGKEYKREVKVGTVKISEVQGDLSVCKVRSGGEEIKKKMDEGKILLLKITSY